MSISLSTLPKVVSKRKKRLGRGLGSGQGAKSGRGTTRHQKARESIPLAFEGGQNRMIKRFPLLRGKGKNKSVRPQALALQIEKLTLFSDGDTITMQALVKKGIIREDIKKVKVVGSGSLSKKLTVQLPVSQSAKNAIEKAGGSVNV